MKHIFIINPESGRGHALRIAGSIERVCKNEGLNYIMHYTKGPKEATQIAKSYKKEKHIIYSVGGDGTLLEIVNGIVDSKNMLGVIPVGSGNDFYRTLQKIDTLKFDIDLGKVNDSYFINVLSLGIDAEINNNANLFKKSVLVPRSQIYNASILYTLFKFKAKKIKFLLNNKTHENYYTIVTVCNAGYYGNGYNIAPNVSLDDGLFDIYFVNKIGKLTIAKLVPKLKKGKHESSSHINKIQSNYIQIQSDNDIVCNIDGETIIGKKFDISIVPKAITIYNNKALVEKFLGNR